MRLLKTKNIFLAGMMVLYLSICACEFGGKVPETPLVVNKINSIYFDPGVMPDSIELKKGAAPLEYPTPIIQAKIGEPKIEYVAGNPMVVDVKTFKDGGVDKISLQGPIRGTTSLYVKVSTINARVAEDVNGDGVLDTVNYEASTFTKTIGILVALQVQGLIFNRENSISLDTSGIPSSISGTAGSYVEYPQPIVSTTAGAARVDYIINHPEIAEIEKKDKKIRITFKLQGNATLKIKVSLPALTVQSDVDGDGIGDYIRYPALGKEESKSITVQ